MNERTVHDEQPSLEELVADWLESEAAGEIPDWLLQSTFDVTRRERQHRGLRHWLARLADALPWPGGGASKRGRRLSTALRVMTVAVLIVVVGSGLLLTLREGPETGPAGVTDSTVEEAHVTELFEVTLGADAIPEELAGILVFRKIYPTDQDVVSSYGFVPPNTFARYVESGELGIRPVSKTRVVRAGSTWADAEVVAAGDEAIVEPGDTFVMDDVPWDEYGPEALGEMWTPGEDARVVGFAIRETSRCCSMSHQGMISPWYHTLRRGLDELRGMPVTLSMRRWDVPVGAELPLAFEGGPTLAAVDAGKITATVDKGPDQEPAVFQFHASMSVQLPETLDAASPVRFESMGTEPAVVYQLIVEPAAGTSAAMEPATAISVTDAGHMSRARSGHEATLLQDGRVLITGGGWADAEIYDPAAGAFEPAGKQARIRSATATLLNDGRVLLAGGSEPSAEIFDPDGLTFELTGPMTEERAFHTSTVLPDGRVLVAGGGTRSVEVYDPASGVFEPAADMHAERAYHASVALPDGRVLISGGAMPATEVFDPSAGTFETLPGTEWSREHHTLTVLEDGRVLVVGHVGLPELFDPASSTFEATSSLAVHRYHHAAARLPDGRVLIVGGISATSGEPVAAIEIFDPATATFSPAGSLLMARWDPTATTLPGGRVLVTGGTVGTSSLAAAELIAVAPAT